MLFIEWLFVRRFEMLIFQNKIGGGDGVPKVFTAPRLNKTTVKRNFQ